MLSKIRFQKILWCLTQLLLKSVSGECLGIGVYVFNKVLWKAMHFGFSENTFYVVAPIFPRMEYLLSRVSPQYCLHADGLDSFKHNLDMIPL